MRHILTILFLQFFWLTIAGIGLGGVLLAYRLRLFSELRRFVGATHPLTAGLVLFGCGTLVLGVVMLPAFLFKWPVAYLTVVYGLLLSCSLFMIVACRRILWRYISGLRESMQGKGVVVLVALAAIVLFDYIFSLKIGGPLFGDAFVHIAKTHLFLTDGFTLEDPFYGYNGVAESRYHVNVLLALNALAAQVLHSNALDVWVYSLAFWRFSIWVALFSLAWVFLPKTVRARWAYGTLAIVPVYYSAEFFYADYPDRVVFLWIALLIIGIRQFLISKKCSLLLLAVALIALTQPLAALIAAGFLALVGLIMLIARSMTKKQFLVLLAAGIVLALPVLFTLTFPNRMSERAIDTPSLILHHLGFITFILPAKIALTLPNILLAISSIGGFVYLFFATKNRWARTLIVLLFLYYGLLIFNPVLLGLAEGRVPLWVIKRFQEMNILWYIAPCIGVFALTEYIARRLQLSVEGAATMALAFVMVYSVGIFKAPQAFWDFKKSFDEDYPKIVQFKNLTPILEGQVVFADNTFTQFRLPAVVRANIVNIEDTHSTPMANIAQRWRCSVRLRESLVLADLQAAKVTRVVANESVDPHLATLAVASPSLIYLAEEGPNKVYKVLETPAPDQTTSICNIPFGQ